MPYSGELRLVIEWDWANGIAAQLRLSHVGLSGTIENPTCLMALLQPSESKFLYVNTVFCFESQFKILPDCQASEEKYPRDHFPASTTQQSAPQTSQWRKGSVWRLGQSHGSRLMLIFLWIMRY